MNDGIALVCADSAQEQRSSEVRGVLRVVKISTIEQQLAHHPAASVLHHLKSTDTHLQTVELSEVRCGLISYRQEWKTDGEYADLTLDGAALMGALAAAKRLQLDALWLDSWCYRFAGKYNHADFCHTLHEVRTKLEAREPSPSLAFTHLPLPSTRCSPRLKLWCGFLARASTARASIPIGFGAPSRQCA